MTATQNTTHANYNEKAAREALADLDAFMMEIRQRGPGNSDIPALAAIVTGQALLAILAELQGLREEVKVLAEHAETQAQCALGAF
jgi:hypothetical protein